MKNIDEIQKQRFFPVFLAEMASCEINSWVGLLDEN